MDFDREALVHSKLASYRNDVALKRRDLEAIARDKKRPRTSRSRGNRRRKEQKNNSFRQCMRMAMRQRSPQVWEMEEWWSAKSSGGDGASSRSRTDTATHQTRRRSGRAN